MPRPISIRLSELIDRAWEQYRGAFGTYLRVTAWLLVPGLLFIISLLLYPTADTLFSGQGLTGLQLSGAILYFTTYALILPLTALWAYVTMVQWSLARLRGGRKDLRASMREGVRRLLPVLGATALLVLSIAAAYVGPLVPGFLLSLTIGHYDAAWMMVLRSLVLLIGVPAAFALAVYAFGVLQFAPVAVAAGDAKAAASLKESFRLVRGRFWGVLFRSLIAKGLFLLLGGVALWIAGSLLSAVTSLALPSSPFAALRLVTIIFSLLSWIIVPMFVTPAVTLVDVNLYRSLKENV